MAARILFIGNFLSRTRGTSSPTERAVNRLQEQGYECILASRFENRALRLLNILLACLFARCDLMQADTFSGRSFWLARLATRIAALRKKPIVLQLHGGGLPEFYAQNPRTTSACLRRATRLHSPSRRIVAFFEEKGFRIEYLPNFIENEIFVYREKQPTGHRILWVRAFAPVYQPELAIQTFARVKKQFPDATLCMAGPDLGLQERCEQLVRQLGLKENVAFPGAIPHHELGALYHAHDVFLNTPQVESFGLAVVEAAACGLPVVSTAVGEIPFLWQHRHNALLASGADAESLAGLIIELFSDPLLAREIGRAAAARATEFHWQNVATSWKKALAWP
jgi:glycosyltransferase involved in cell wall biosynthesis